MCVRNFLLGIFAKGGFFAIREHAQLQWESAGKLKRLGRTEGGRLREQRVCIKNDKGERVYLRRVVVDLDEPTQDGDTYIAVLCNLPEKDADARAVAKLYRRRGAWGGRGGGYVGLLHGGRDGRGHSASFPWASWGHECVCGTAPG